MDEYATSRTTSIGITLDRKHERSYHKAMNNPDATTIKVAKDTRILATLMLVIVTGKQIGRAHV